MILYNVTVKVERDIHEDWLAWMRKEHIPDVLSTGHFVSHRICRLLHEEEDGITYAVQYFAHSLEDIQAYQQGHAQRLQAEHARRYKDRFVAFRTLMEIV